MSLLFESGEPTSLRRRKVYLPAAGTAAADGTTSSSSSSSNESSLYPNDIITTLSESVTHEAAPIDAASKLKSDATARFVLTVDSNGNTLSSPAALEFKVNGANVHLLRLVLPESLAHNNTQQRIVASALSLAAFGHAKTNNQRVLPISSFVSRIFLKKYPQYQDLVVAGFVVTTEAEEKLADDTISEGKQERPRSSSVTNFSNAFSTGGSAGVMDEHGQLIFEGSTYTGTKFKIPPSLSTVDAFYPKNITWASFITIIPGLISTYLVFFCNFSKWFHMANFLFFRFGYDIGIGLLLRSQSNHSWMTKTYQRWNKNKAIKPWLNRFIVAGLRPQYRDEALLEKLPDEFKSWVVFKYVVTTCLVNDGWSYILLGLKCFYWPSTIDGLLIVQYSIGLALAGFNYWAKVDAHRCIGEYCWYWGDFFYRKDQNLTFDGIFELFPHPMYTVGYSLYYGYSLICRSYTMLFVSLFAHLLQILFLVLVEEPHIEKIYGTKKVADEDKARVLYDPRSGLFPRKDSVYLFFIDLFNPSDIALICLSAYAILLAWSMDNPLWCIVQVVVWRLIHWVGLGSVLWLQSERQYWTRHFMSRGRTLYEAFTNWKRLYNLSLTMNVIVFIGCAIRHVEFDFPADLTSGHAMGCVVCGIILIALNLWSSSSTYQSVGDFGWFYGDFFISTDAYRNHLCYTGIYRFLNNPDCVTGYAGYYGLALIGRSWTLFGLAAFSQVLNVLFLVLVEVPHMRKLYEKKVRDESPVPRAIIKALPAQVKEQQLKMETSLKNQAKKIKQRALREAYEVYKRLETARQKMKADNAAAGAVDASQPSASVSTNVEAIVVGDPLEVSYETDDNHPDTDWIGVYPVDVDSTPGASDGKWVYVPAGSKGTVRIPPSLLPQSEGIYQVRYHYSGIYKQLASCTIRIESLEDKERKASDEDPSLAAPARKPASISS